MSFLFSYCSLEACILALGTPLDGFSHRRETSCTAVLGAGNGLDYGGGSSSSNYSLRQRTPHPHRPARRCKASDTRCTCAWTHKGMRVASLLSKPLQLGRMAARGSVNRCCGESLVLLIRPFTACSHECIPHACRKAAKRGARWGRGAGEQCHTFSPRGTCSVRWLPWFPVRTHFRLSVFKEQD